MCYWRVIRAMCLRLYGVLVVISRVSSIVIIIRVSYITLKFRLKKNWDTVDLRSVERLTILVDYKSGEAGDKWRPHSSQERSRRSRRWYNNWLYTLLTTTYQDMAIIAVGQSAATGWPALTIWSHPHLFATVYLRYRYYR
eukprot:7584368-Pyramimonas_sp.AAC.1